MVSGGDWLVDGDGMEGCGTERCRNCLLSLPSRPAPLLKNTQLSESKARELYLQVIQYMRRMYQDARLVHADLSEFNML